MKFQAGVFDSNNQTLALRLEYIPLWLAKINITPTMREENPKLAEKLIAYQLKAKDALAAAFLDVPRSMTQNEIIAAMAQANVENERKLRELSERVDAADERIKYAASTFLMPVGSGAGWEGMMSRTIDRICEQGGLNRQTFRFKLYRELETALSIDLERRRRNAVKRMVASGVKQHKARDISKLYVISLDPALRSAFDLIVRKYAAQCMTEEGAK